MSPDLIGRAASAILLLTLCRQIHMQAKDESARGVSHWLFAGQTAASAGFIAYSGLLHNWPPRNGRSSSPAARSW